MSKESEKTRKREVCEQGGRMGRVCRKEKSLTFWSVPDWRAMLIQILRCAGHSSRLKCNAVAPTNIVIFLPHRPSRRWVSPLLKEPCVLVDSASVVSHLRFAPIIHARKTPAVNAAPSVSRTFHRWSQCQSPSLIPRQEKTEQRVTYWIANHDRLHAAHRVATSPNLVSIVI